MHNIADSELIETIWTALKARKVAKRPQTISQLTNRFVTQGWACLEDVKDLIWATDGRFDDHQISKLAATLNIPVRGMYHRPTRSSSSQWGYQAMTTADVASLLIQLERLGLDVDPLILVEPMLEKLRKAKYLNDSELSIIWYRKDHKKISALILVEAPESIGTLSEELITPTDFRVEIWRDDRGKATMLQSFAPKYRSRRNNLGWAA